MRSLSYYWKNKKKSYHLARIKLAKRFPTLFSDRMVITSMFYNAMGYELDLNNPRTFSEKLQWLKLYDRNPLYTVLADKVKVKDYVGAIIGEEHIIPTLGVWDRAEDVDFDNLPDRFVIKCNHNSGIGLYICNDKATMDRESVINGLSKGLKEDYFLRGREWPYREIPRKIIAEKYIEAEPGKDLIDYKFYCFNGTPVMCQVISDRRTDKKFDFYDMNWVRLIGLIGLSPDAHTSEYDLPRPGSWDKMKELAKKLCGDYPFSRIDFYDVNGKCYFGEITFYPNSGFGFFKPDKWNLELGALIPLRKFGNSQDER